jgi:hypothetical protein
MGNPSPVVWLLILLVLLAILILAAYWWHPPASPPPPPQNTPLVNADDQDEDSFIDEPISNNPLSAKSNIHNSSVTMSSTHEHTTHTTNNDRTTKESISTPIDPVMSSSSRVLVNDVVPSPHTTTATITQKHKVTETNNSQVPPAPVIDQTVPTYVQTPPIVVDQTPAPIVEQNLTPIVEQTPPVVEQTPPIVEQTPPIVEQTPAPFVEQNPAPVVEQTLTPVVEQTPPVVEQTPPVVEQTPTHVVEQTLAPVVEQTPTPVVEQTLTPVVEQTHVPVVQETSVHVVEKLPSSVITELPVVQETSGAAKRIVPVIQKQQIVIPVIEKSGSESSKIIGEMNKVANMVRTLTAKTIVIPGDETYGRSIDASVTNPAALSSDFSSMTEMSPSNKKNRSIHVIQ